MKRTILKLAQPILAVALGLTLGLLVAMIAGENPWHVIKILANGAFGSTYDVGMTLYYATPLVFTGFSVAIAFHAGLFNIGAEGQLLFGALAAASVGALFPDVPWPMAPILAGLAAFVAGAMWGVIPGWLRAKRGSHEVVNTIMLNFVAAGITSWITLNFLPNPESQNPETRPIGVGYLINHLDFFGGAPVGLGSLLALVVAFLFWCLLWKTVFGYELRVVGQNEVAARAAGIRAARIRILSMAIAGGLAGLVGVSEVLGNSGKFRIGFSPDYGFMGIAVALLGRNKPIGILASALLFGALHKGAADLDFETETITKDIALVLQALVILSVSADGLWSWVKLNNGSKQKKGCAT